MKSAPGKCRSLSTLLIVLILVVSSVLSFVQDDQSAWDDFKKRYNKTYTNREEEQLRRQIFFENKHFTESHNVKTQATFTQGINSLSDLTTEEINKSRNGFRIIQEPFYEFQSVLGRLLELFNETAVSSGGSSPEFVAPANVSSSDEKGWFDNLFRSSSLDYRDLGRVSKVKDQGSCGSCWAFATTGALESMLAARSRKILLSEQNLVDCSRSYGNFGCSGGLMDSALRYVRDRGIMAAIDYPYTGKDGTCKAQRSKIVTRVRSSFILPPGNEALLRIALSMAGPLPVAIDAAAKSFHMYKSGVYDDRVCRNGNSELNHALLLVGFGTDKVGGDYWLLKNSWGRNWGDQGYIKVARNRNNLCGVATYAVLPIP